VFEAELAQHIIFILKKNKQMIDKQLYDVLRKFAHEVTWSDFNRVLMVLELRGYVRVVTMSKSRRYVELIR